MPHHHPLRLTAGVTLAVLLTLVGGLLTAAPAQATLYDSVVVDDPVGDLQGSRFPDLTQVRFHHDVVDGREFLTVRMQLRKDARWRPIRTAGFKANKYSITTNGLEDRFRVHIRRPGGSEYVCHRCTVRVREARRRIVFILPWPRIGSPEYVKFSPSFVSAGYVMDTAEAPYRALY